MNMNPTTGYMLESTTDDFIYYMRRNYPEGTSFGQMVYVLEDVFRLIYSTLPDYLQDRILDNLDIW